MHLYFEESKFIGQDALVCIEYMSFDGFASKTSEMFPVIVLSDKDGEKEERE